jgi:streptomycin 3"-adenylyltransferase
VLVVARVPIAAAQRATLVPRPMAISGSGGRVRPVELKIVVHPEVRPWRYPPLADFLYGEWLRNEYEREIVPPPATPRRTSRPC